MKLILREGKDKYALRGVMCSPEDKSPALPEPCCSDKLDPKKDEPEAIFCEIRERA